MLSQIKADIALTLSAYADSISDAYPERVFSVYQDAFRPSDWSRLTSVTNGLHVFQLSSNVRPRSRGGDRYYQNTAQIFIDCVTVQKARRLPSGLVTADEMAGATLDFLVADVVEALFGAAGINLSQPAGTYETGIFPQIDWFDTTDLIAGPEMSILVARITYEVGFEYKPGGVEGTPIDMISARITGANPAGADVEPEPPEYY